MNVALTYYKCLDDWQDDRNPAARLMAKSLEPHLQWLRQQYPRQCSSIEGCIGELSMLEAEGCLNPDLPANCFGRLMAELLVYREDLWAKELRQLGFYLGRFVYLADAVVDHRKDMKKQKYNPLKDADPDQWEAYLVLAMGKCTEHFERLPLVQDKDILDNILYSGVWSNVRRKGRKNDDGRSL
jgi:hypothetical protein